MQARTQDELGIGIAYGARPGEYGASGYDFAEVAPCVDARTRPIDGALPQAVLNSTWLPVGGSCEPEEKLLGLLYDNVKARRPALVIERLGFNRFATGAGSRATGLLLPAPQTLDGVTIAVRRIVDLRERLGVPVAFEIGMNPLGTGAHDLSGADFYSAVAELADCGIVLDLASLWANERNGREAAEQLARSLPLERIWEVQVSGTTTFGTFTLDTQSGLVGDAIRRLAEQVVPQLPALRAIVYEVRPDSLPGIGARALAGQRSWLNALWETRGTRLTGNGAARVHPSLPAYDDARRRVGGWERSVIAGIAGLKLAGARDSEAFALLESLIASARRTAIAEAAQLSLRLLEATLGRHALADLLRRYCSETCAEFFAVTEALHFLQFVERERASVPFLREVVAFERAAVKALRGEAETAIHFPCEPTEIFRALLRHDRPYVSDLRPHVVHVGPRGIRIEGAYRQAG